MIADATRARILAEALDWVGTPYRHQGSRKGVGCDCLGLVRGIWREIYGFEPESPGAYAPDWAEADVGDRLLEAAGRHCEPLGPLEAGPGDLVVFRWRPEHAAKHLGILTSPTSFIHAYEGQAVTVSPLIPHWRRKIAGAFAFPAAPPAGQGRP